MVLLFGTSVFAVIRWQIEPMYSHFFRPSVEDLAKLPVLVINPDPEADTPVLILTEEDEEGNIVEVYAERNINKINFLLLGIDEHANTDVVMVASFDIEEHTLDIVSIPRDTLVNVSWNLKKVNSIHAYMRHQHRNDSEQDEKAMVDTIEHFRDILGFHVDYLVSINMNAFIRVIDAVGPIPFNVPVNVSEAGVSVPRGQRNLNGREALTVMRSRRSYANHAIGRDFTQQEFLQAVAATILANRNNINVTDMVDIFFRNVKTNIPLNLLVGYGTEFLKMNNDNIRFHMMPGAIDSVGAQSYITILVDEWLELVNEFFNPFDEEITVHNTSILTRGADRRLMVTNGQWQGNSSWGSSSVGSSNPYLTTDSDRPVPLPSGTRAPALVDDGGNVNPATGEAGGGDEVGPGGGEEAP